MGSTTLSKQIESTAEEAKQFMDEFMNSYPALKQFIAKTKGLAEETKYCKTIFGRRRCIIQAGQSSDLSSRGGRIAVNTTIQV